MAYAAILSFEEFRDTQRRAEIRQRLHDRMDQWLDTLEARVKEPQPTLEQLTQAVFALRQELTQAVTESLVEHAHRAVVEQRTATCPQCGQTVSARGPQERTVETLVGAIRLRRPYFYCARCQRGTAPLDEVLQLTGRRTQPDVQKAGGPGARRPAPSALAGPGSGGKRKAFGFTCSRTSASSRC